MICSIGIPLGDTINEIIKETNLTNIAAFHAQQCIEKSLKAMMEEYELPYKKIHSLETLIEKLKMKIGFEIKEDIILKLDTLYIEARYPGELGLLPNGKPSIDEAKDFFNYAKYVNKKINDLFE